MTAQEEDGALKQPEKPDVKQRAADYVAELTGLEDYFTFLRRGEDAVAVFRRFSFILADKYSMIRLRLLPEVTPKAQSSFINGLYVGDIRVGKDGVITRPLSEPETRLMRYLLRQPMGAWMIEKESEGCFRMCYPGDFVEALIRSAQQMAGDEPEIAVENLEWRVRLPGVSMQIDRFRQYCRITTSEERLLDILKADDKTRSAFRKLSCPCILWAFGRVIDAHGPMRFCPETASQIPDRAMEKLIADYENVRQDFLSGKPRETITPFPLPEIVGLPPAHLEEPDDIRMNTPKPSGLHQTSIRMPGPQNSRLIKEIAQRQYLYLKDCIAVGEELARDFDGTHYTGVMTPVDPAIYPPVWIPDHYFNTLAMLDFDPETAKRMCIGGFLSCMEFSGLYRGQLSVKKGKAGPSATYPVWFPVTAEVFERTGDKDFLKSAFPLLEMNDEFVGRHFLRDGVYAGAGGFWNDYSTGPKKLSKVAGIGMNALIALQKNLLARIASALGFEDKARRWKDEGNALAAQVNSRFWNEGAGLYFDYDTETRAAFVCPSGGLFYGLDNLLPLFAGIVPEDRIERIEKHLTSSRSYGKYAAITTDLSPDFMDERRLMVWVMTNWLVVRGLRNYRLDHVADSIAVHIFNAFLRSWVESRSLPEALSATHGLTPMENENIAGVGSWAAFYLYLKEIQRAGLDAAR